MTVPVLPNITNRLTMVGRTGSGKTLAALWHLSKQPISKMPWIVLDFKGEEAINSIRRAHHIDFDFVPNKPGVYILHPRLDQKKELEEYLWKIWEHKRIGIYCDEGYMVENSMAFDANLTQGRSRITPMIVLCQRPAWISRFVFSEASYFQIFAMNDDDDMETLRRFMPRVDMSKLPDFNSYYYDVSRRKMFQFLPVPSQSETLASIDSQLFQRRI